MVQTQIVNFKVAGMFHLQVWSFSKIANPVEEGKEKNKARWFKNKVLE